LKRKIEVEAKVLVPANYKPDGYEEPIFDKSCSSVLVVSCRR
jgi:hypothetical protein